MGPDKFGTGPLRDLIGSVPKRSHEGGPKVFQTARPFQTWAKARQKVKILRNKFEKQVSFGHRVFMLRLGHCKNLLLYVHFSC